MPGVVYKKRSGGEQYPDWTKIGYARCPDTTVDGWQVALDIHDNWDTSVTNFSGKYVDRYDLMYFPKNVDTTGITTFNNCFNNSNIETIDIDVSGVTAYNGLQNVFLNCKNLRSAKIVNDLTAGATIYSSMFENCLALEEVDIDLELPGEHNVVNSIEKMFKNCYNLKTVPRITQAHESGTALEICSYAFQNCYKLEELNIVSYHIKNLNYNEYIGYQTTNGCKMNITAGSLANSDLEAGFKFSKIADGSSILLDRVRNQEFDTFYGCIFMPGKIEIEVNPKMNDYINAYRMFKEAKFNDDVDTSHTFIKIDDVSNAGEMFDATVFNSTNKKLDISNIDLNQCTIFDRMFRNSNVVTIVGLDNVSLYSATSFTNMFEGCSTLDNDTVDDLLLTLTTATSYSGTKTLAQLGFTAANYPAATIQSLSNYTAFTGAGWAIGY